MGDKYICLACGSNVDSESQIDETYTEIGDRCSCCGKIITNDVSANKTEMEKAIPR
ncbi:MAG: hypothetical protein ACLFMM_04275 [Methanohalobium sp.]|uniref:hypothetical protein n=1 Tax=Methanohalobium sp. TaxID=2837493 RepID=UPI00397B1651